MRQAIAALLLVGLVAACGEAPQPVETPKAYAEPGEPEVPQPEPPETPAPADESIASGGSTSGGAAPCVRNPPVYIPGPPGSPGRWLPAPDLCGSLPPMPSPTLTPNPPLPLAPPRAAGE